MIHVSHVGLIVINVKMEINVINVWIHSLLIKMVSVNNVWKVV